MTTPPIAGVVDDAPLAPRSARRDRSASAAAAPPARALLVGRVAVGVLLVVFVVAGLVQAWTDSPTVDEGVDLSSGLSHLVHHDLRSSPEHPPLPQVLAAAPALLAHPIVPQGEAWTQDAWFDHTSDVLAANDQAGRLRRIVFLSRLVPLIEAVACGLLMFALARRLAGEEAGLLAAGLWFGSPFVLGFGHVQSIDVAFTLATLVVVWTLVRHAEAPSPARAAAVGAALAASLATRHSALVLVALALVVVGVRVRADRRDVLRQAGLTALVAYAGLWLLYRGFDPTSPGGAAGAQLDGIVGAAQGQSLVARLVLAVPAPQEWRTGFAYLTLTSDPRPAWLFGQAWAGTRWWFFPGSLVAKVPLVALVVLLLGPLGWWWVDRARRRRAAMTVALPALALLVFTAVQPLALGLRLALPSLALGMVLAGAAAVPLVRIPVGRALLGAVAVLQLVALLSASSHALAWVPPPLRPAYRYVSDSNVDFGQDLWRVRAWSEGRDPWVAVVGPRGLEVGGDTRELVDAEPGEVTGWVAVGATALTVTQRDSLSWLRRYCPVATLGGGSVLVYRFDEPPSAEPGPDRPVAPCVGDEVSRAG